MSLIDLLLDRLGQVRRNLGMEPDVPADAATQLGDVLDSMAMVELLGLLAEDCGVKPSAIEECVGRRFGTVAELAQAMEHSGVLPRSASPVAPASRGLGARDQSRSPEVWLAATAVCLAKHVQSAAELNALLQRPAGWFERHAGIHSRRVWRDYDPLTAAVEAGQTCLDRAGLSLQDVGVLLVTSEAPPLLAGLAAALHHGLNLPARTVALEIGGACTGFLASLWTAQRLLPTAGVVLILAVEAASQYLPVKPGQPGEAAALFGDGVAACVLTDRLTTAGAVALREVFLGAAGGAASLLRVCRDEARIEVHMEGNALAGRALATMAESVHVLLQRHGLQQNELRAVVMHGGNGRMPGLLARQLGLPAERVWSTTPETGNLGSASHPAAWEVNGPTGGPVVWVGVGAGLTWGAALLG